MNKGFFPLCILILLGFNSSCASAPIQNGPDKVAYGFGEFSLAYFDFFYEKKDPRRSAHVMRDFVKGIPEYSDSLRIPLYTHILLRYRFDGEFLNWFRKPIASRKDRGKIIERLSKMHLVFSEDEVKRRQVIDFLNSIKY